MTNDEIIAMAAQVWSANGVYIGPSIAQLTEFAALVTAKEREARQQAQREAEALRERIVKSGLELHRAVRDAAKDEREACAVLCESRHENGNYKYDHRDECAQAIREKCETK